MIVAVHNDVLNSIDLMVDEEGANTLIDVLQRVKSQGHIHLWSDPELGGDLSPTSPYGHDKVYQELVVGWIGD
jgi:hypothetical protein